MEIRIIKETNEDLEFELPGESHTFCNLLADRLLANENVVFAAYKVEHPLVSFPVVYLRVREGIEVPQVEEKKVELDQVPGVGVKRKEQLIASGIKYANDLLRADIEELSKSSGIPKKTLEKMVAEAKKLDYGRLTAARFVLMESLKEIKQDFGQLKEKLSSLN